MSHPASTPMEIELPSTFRWYFHSIAGFQILAGLAWTMTRLNTGDLSMIAAIGVCVFATVMALITAAIGELSRRHLRIWRDKSGKLKAQISRYVFLKQISKRRFPINAYSTIKILTDWMPYGVALSNIDEDLIVFRTGEDDELREYVSKLEKLTGWPVTR
jgi:hypothetical protein